jgi:hypothetical protein
MAVIGLALPVDLLDVVIDARGQAIATLQAAALEDVTATTGRHALPETVNAHSAADFGLVSSLWHGYFFL